MKIDLTFRETNNLYENKKILKQKNDEYANLLNEIKNETSKRCDKINISDEGLKYRADKNKPSASSGKDILEIKKGSTENQFKVLFSDSAMVSRAVSRGYVEVNGKRIDLSDDVKKKLAKVDKLAQRAREKAFAYHTARHDMMVEQHTNEVLKKASEKDTDAFVIASKMSGGTKVSHEEESMLLHHDPQMYLMAKIAQAMAKHQKEDKNKLHLKKSDESDEIPVNEDDTQITFKTEMSVDVSDGTINPDNIKISSDTF